MRRQVDESEFDDDEPDWTSDDDEPSNDEGTIECPYCHAEVYVDSPRCPRCENYLSREDEPAPSKPLWIWVGAIVCLLTACLWLWR